MLSYTVHITSILILFESRDIYCPKKNASEHQESWFCFLRGRLTQSTVFQPRGNAPRQQSPFQ